MKNCVVIGLSFFIIFLTSCKKDDDEIIRPTSDPLKEGLVAYYPFNGNANDESGKGNNGVINAATLTNGRTGNVNGAYSFNGTSSAIMCGNGNSIQISGDITVCAWIKTSTLPTNSKVVISKYGNGTGGWLIGTANDSTGKIWFDGRDGSGFYRSSGGTIKIDNNLWHFVVGQRQGSIWKIFIDGMLAGQNDVGTSGSLLNSNQLTIGAQSDPGNTWWNGLIDDVRIYNRALSSTEIQSLFNEK